MASLDVLVNVLSRAVTVDAGNNNDRAAADAQLKSWEGVPGYNFSLLEISNREDLPFKARHLAALCLKNGVDKYWRKSAPKAMLPDEKAKIREGISSLICTDSKPLSKAYSETLAKIARIDFPNEWPNLIDILMQTVRGTFDLPVTVDAKRRFLVQRHAVYTFHRVIKVLYSMPMMHHKRLHYEVSKHLPKEISNNVTKITPALFKYFSSLFFATADAFLTMAASPVESRSLTELEGNIETARYAFKCLRTLMCFGYPEKSTKESGNKRTFNDVEDTVAFLSCLPTYLEKILQTRSALFVNATTGSKDMDSSKKALESLCISIGKLYRDLQTHRFVNFCLAPNAINVVRFYWGNVSSYFSANGIPPEDPFLEKILLQCIHMLRAMIKPTELDVASGAQRHPRCDEAKEKLRTELWTPEFIVSALETLVLKIMQLSPDDISKWEEEPESFLENEKNDSWEYSLRLSADNTVSDLVNRNKEHLAPVLLNFLRQVSDISSKAELASILLKDAVYSALGLCAYDLYDYVDFDAWFEKTLVHEVDADCVEIGASILNRRICFLVSSWCNVKMSPRLLSTVYGLLITLALPGKDLVLRLTAIIGLRNVIGESHMEVDSFLPFAETAINILLQTLEELEEYETRIIVADCLTTVISHLGLQIVSKVPLITSKIPRLWELSDLQPLFRISVLNLLKELTQALQTHSVELHPFVLPIIRMSFESNQRTTYIEDTLDLWLSCVRNSPEITPSLFELLPWMEHIFELNSEYLKTALRILETFFLLSPSAVFQSPAIVGIFAKVLELLSGLRLEASTEIIKTLTICLRSSAQASCMKPCIQALMESGLFGMIIREVLNSSESERVSNYIQANLCSLIECVNQLAPGLQMTSSPMANILIAMNSLYDAVTYKRQKKIMAMAMARLLATGNQNVFQVCSVIFATISSVVAEISDLGMDAEKEMAFWFVEKTDNEYDDSPDTVRRANLETADPIASGPLIPFLRERILEAQKAVGGAAQFEQIVAQTVEIEVLRDFLQTV
ncbi:Importin-11 [Dinochytrium kinnereticum]|nr:Importin-11 [Dinochytrium kinnereticum]